MKPTAGIFVLISILIACSAAASAGTLAGVVRGPGGVGLPGAMVTARADGTSSAPSVVTGEDGAFRIDGLQPGDYSVEGELHGFHSARTASVTIRAEGVTTVVLSLSTATFHDTMLVESESPHDSLEASEIRESAARDLGEALARKPGLWKVRKGGIANDVVLRGFREDDITVLIDGARVAGACPNRMDPPAFHIDFAEVDRVEIAPGDGRMAAQGSLGGLINVVTKKPGPGLHLDASIVAGSWGSLNPSLTASYGSESFAVLGGMSHRSAEPFEDGAGNTFTEGANYRPSLVQGIDAYDVNSAWTRLYYVPAPGHELHLSFARQDADDVLYPTLMMDALYDTTDRLVAGYRYDVDDGLLRSLRATVYGTRVDHWMVDSLRMTSTNAPREWSMGTEATTRIVGGTVEAELGPVVVGLETYTRNWTAWTEMAGMGYMRQYSIPDVDLDALGLSARWSLAVAPRTTVGIGARIDRIATRADSSIANTSLYAAYHGVTETSRTDTEPSFSLRIQHQISSQLQLSGGLTRTSRSPDARERYFALRRMGSDWVGNPVLEPPQATGAEIGLVWGAGGGMLSASAWAERVDGFVLPYNQQRIEPVPGVMNTKAMSYGNVQADLLGASVSGSLALSSRLSLAGSATFVRGTQEPDPQLGTTSRNLPEMPPLSGRLAVRWQNTKVFAEAEGIAAADQERVNEDLSESPTPGWAILNLKAGWSWQRWRVAAVLANVFDRTYHEHFSYLRNPYRSGFVLNEPGRNFAVTLGWRY